MLSYLPSHLMTQFIQANKVKNISRRLDTKTINPISLSTHVNQANTQCVSSFLAVEPIFISDFSFTNLQPWINFLLRSAENIFSAIVLSWLVWNSKAPNESDSKLENQCNRPRVEQCSFANMLNSCFKNFKNQFKIHQDACSVLSEAGGKLYTKSLRLTMLDLSNCFFVHI